MLALARGTTVGPLNPRLVFFAAQLGLLVDPYALSFAVYDVSDETKQLTPVVVQAKTAVNLVTERLGVGRYAPTWVCSPSAAVGEYEVRWYFRLTSTDAEVEVRQSFEVLTNGQVLTPYYCLLSDLRAEGVTTSDASDARAIRSIQKASQLIEMYTGRFFEPRYLDLRFDGTGGRFLMLTVPVVAVEGFSLTTLGVNEPLETPDPDFFRVYNRHLTGLLSPDDRNDPKVELFATDWAGHIGIVSSLGTWEHYPRGRQNIRVLGVFGYTEPDGSPFGTTPPLLRQVAAKLALREMWKLNDRDAQEDAKWRWRLTSERTRDQAYTLADPKGSGSSGAGAGFTGDWEIDSVLASFKRPPQLGSA